MAEPRRLQSCPPAAGDRRRHNAAERAQTTLLGKSKTYETYYSGEIQRRIRQQKKPDTFTRPPEAVAEKILSALESPSPKRRYRVTIPAYLGTWAARFAPDWLLDWANTRKLPDA